MPTKKKQSKPKPRPKPRSRDGSLFSLTVKNFGPISSGTLDVRPLTVLIGPNNSGKSYVGMLIYALYKTGAKNQWLANAEREIDDSKIRPKLLALNPGQTLKLDDLEEMGGFEIANAVERIFENHFEIELHKIMNNTFYPGIENLISKGEKSFSLDLSLPEIEARLSYDPPDLLIMRECRFKKRREMLFRSVTGEKGSYELTDNKYYINMPRDAIINAQNIFEMVFMSARMNYGEEMIRPLREGCFHFPSGRTSLILTKNELGASALEDKLSDLTGVTREFAANSIRLKPENIGPMFDFASELERGILQGSVVLESTGQFTMPKIFFITNGLKLPLHLASSTVTELAPLILFLKHLIAKPCTIIIDEPEAHLHPANQLKLAKYLVRLIRRGFKIIITTHSDYLLEQINNFVMLSGLDEKTRKKRYGYGPDDYLLPLELSASLFKYSPSSKGYRITSLPVTVEDGISLDSFTDVALEMRNEGAAITEDLIMSKRKK